MSAKTENKEQEAIKKKASKEEKFDSNFLAARRLVHPYRVAFIRQEEGLEDGFMTTEKELLKLLKKYFGDEFEW